MLNALLTVRCLTYDPVGTWSKDVTIKLVASTCGRHSTHSYFRTNPESYDGKRVLFFTSTYPQCHLGEVRMFERSTGKETELAENVHTEDAHRVSCQQWLSGGKRVKSHEVIEKNWRAVVLEVETLKKKIVAASPPQTMSPRHVQCQLDPPHSKSNFSADQLG